MLARLLKVIHAIEQQGIAVGPFVLWLLMQPDRVKKLEEDIASRDALAVATDIADDYRAWQASVVRSA